MDTIGNIPQRMLGYILGIVLTTCSGCSLLLDRAAPLSLAREVAAYSPAYLLNEGDHLQIHHPYEPELDEEVVVRPDGRINISLGGELVAADRALDTLACDVTDRLGSVALWPDLVIEASDPAGALVSVGGAVAQPQRVPLSRAGTVAEAIFASGGLDYFGDTDRVILLRRLPGGETRALRVELADDGTGDNNLPLASRDVIFVPETRLGTAVKAFERYVNAILPDRHNISVLRAINNASQKSSVVGSSSRNGSNNRAQPTPSVSPLRPGATVRSIQPQKPPPPANRYTASVSPAVTQPSRTGSAVSRPK